MKKIIVFNGIHGSGKSTLAKLLTKEQQGITYFHEIGGQLREEVDYNALNSGETFDLAVMQRELVRDGELLNCINIPVVETWHIGNIAYMLTRNPQLFNEYHRKFEYQLRLFEPIAVLVEIGWNTFKQRATENIQPGQMDTLIDFYKKILDFTYIIYKDFNIKYFSVRNEGTLQESMVYLREALIARGLLSEGVTKGKERG